MEHYSESPVLGSMFESNAKLADEIREIIARGNVPGLTTGSDQHQKLEQFLDPARKKLSSPPRMGAERADSVESFPRPSFGMEAIVRLIGRPPLLVQNGTFIAPENASDVIPQQTLTYIKNELDRSFIDPVIDRVGRLDLIDVPHMPFVGTGWIIEKKSATSAIVITNRHVAEEFGRADGYGGYRFKTAPNYRSYEGEVDFLREHDRRDRQQVRIDNILFIAGPNDPDIALLEVSGDVLREREAIELESNKVRIGQKIGVVGYPAFDSRNDANAMADYFQGIFNKKRFAFGEINGASEKYSEITHDATTLGGNSGSVVFDLASGKAVGLHFSGSYAIGNYAVNSEAIARALAGLTSKTIVSRGGTEAISDGVKPVSFYEGRNGYGEDFLGCGDKTVAYPQLGDWSCDVALVKDADGGDETSILKYQNFSVITCKSRKLPLLTAVNIDGKESKRLGRTDRWFVDGRMDESYQTGNEAYKYNPLDRGHMVRREDPVWGTLEEAQRANIDTFHYANAAPQHKGLNQKDWVRLEDYIIGSARTHELKVSVFTGPVLREDDEVYRDVVKLPRDFWKIAVVVDAQTDTLSATGYVLTQGDLIRDISEAFVYGAFRTYQVPVSLISKESGLDFSHLDAFDPLARQRENEGLSGSTSGLFVAIGSSADIRLH